MKLIKHVLTIIPILFCINYINAQPDKWFIKDGYYISGFSGTSSDRNSYTRTSIPTTSNNYFDINGVSHPAQYNSSIPEKKYANDVFIIFGNGNYYNSRHYGFPNQFSGTPGGFGYNLTLALGSAFSSGPTLFDIKYLYFTDKYEGDDPPSGLIYIKPNSTSSSLTPVQITDYNQNSTVMTANHDIVPDDDITYIIPKNLIINAHCAPGTLRLTYPTDVLELSPIFGNVGSESICFNCNPNTTTLGIIDNITFDVNPYQFINLKGKSTVTFNSDNPTPLQCTVNLECLSNPTTGTYSQIATLTESVRQSHDPNLVRIKCIWLDNDGKYWVKYYIQFYNDGDVDVENPFINFVLPSFFDANSIQTCRWNFANCGSSCNTTNSFSCDISTPPNIKFQFLDNDCKLPGIGNAIPNFDQLAWVEFCVKIQNNDFNPCLSSTNLELILPETDFNPRKYTIHHFEDILVPCENSGNRNIKEAINIKPNSNIRWCRIPSPTCNCDCPKKKKCLLNIFKSKKL